MSEQGVTILLVEDNADHAALIKRQLNKMRSGPAHVDVAESFSDAINNLKRGTYDLMLLDLRLPDSDLESTFARMSAAVPDMPIIILTSLDEFDFAVNLVKQGAQDFLVKAEATPELLARAIYYAIERKQNQLELRRYAAELERANRELDQFTRVVSHDLKSPLAVMQMELNALEQDEQLHGSDSVARIENIGATAKRMWRLIDDLLRYARLGNKGLEMEQIDCDDLVRRVVTELAPRIEQACATINVDVLPQVWGHRIRLAQLFQNLISNALAYAGDKPPRVHVSAEFHGPDWVFSVEDHGVGIPAEDRERVFDMFTRLHGEDVPGTGVGLAICKRVVESHGGRIWLDSERGRGTTFYFTLPARPPAARAEPHGDDDAEQTPDESA